MSRLLTRVTTADDSRAAHTLLGSECVGGRPIHPTTSTGEQIRGSRPMMTRPTDARRLATLVAASAGPTCVSFSSSSTQLLLQSYQLAWRPTGLLNIINSHGRVQLHPL